VRLRECCTREAQEVVQLDVEKTAAWRVAHQGLLRRKEEWFSELQSFEQDRKAQKKEVMKNIRADVLKTQNKLVKGSLMFEEIIHFLKARSLAEATYSKALVGLAELKIRKPISGADADEEEEEEEDDTEEVSDVEDTISAPVSPDKKDAMPPTPPNTGLRPSEDGDPSPPPTHKRSKSSPEAGDLIRKAIFIPEKTEEELLQGATDNIRKGTDENVEKTLADAARKLSVSIEDDEPLDDHLMPPEFIGQDPEVYEAYDRVAALMTNFTNFLQTDLVKVVHEIATDYMKVTNGFFRTEIAELQASSQQSERELSMAFSTLKRAHSEMCRASAFDVQQLTLKLMNSDGEETVVTRFSNGKGMLRPDVWLPEQKYLRALHTVNQVLERIADRVHEVRQEVLQLEHRKEVVLHYVNNSIVKHQSQLWAKVCTIGYDMGKDSGKIGEGIDEETNEFDEDEEEEVNELNKALETVNEEEDPHPPAIPPYELNLPSVPETKLISLKGTVEVKENGKDPLSKSSPCIAILTMDRYLHLFREDITLPWFGTNPFISINLREATMAGEGNDQEYLLRIEQLKKAAFGMKSQWARTILAFKNEEDFLNWTSAIFNPLKDFGAPELAPVGSIPALGEGLSRHNSQMENVVTIEEELASPRDKPQKKGAYMTYLDGLNRILGVQIDVVDPSEAEEMALKRESSEALHGAGMERRKSSEQANKEEDKIAEVEVEEDGKDEDNGPESQEEYENTATAETEEGDKVNDQDGDPEFQDPVVIEES